MVPFFVSFLYILCLCCMSSFMYIFWLSFYFINIICHSRIEGFLYIFVLFVPFANSGSFRIMRFVCSLHTLHCHFYLTHFWAQYPSMWKPRARRRLDNYYWGAPCSVDGFWVTVQIVTSTMCNTLKYL